eukprot:SAG31_NODE_9320_length_1298_cov_1.751460_1_plen_165_part_00
MHNSARHVYWAHSLSHASGSAFITKCDLSLWLYVNQNILIFSRPSALNSYLSRISLSSKSSFGRTRCNRCSGMHLQRLGPGKSSWRASRHRTRRDAPPSTPLEFIELACVESGGFPRASAVFSVVFRKDCGAVAKCKVTSPRRGTPSRQTIDACCLARPDLLNV